MVLCICSLRLTSNVSVSLQTRHSTENNLGREQMQMELVYDDDLLDSVLSEGTCMKSLVEESSVNAALVDANDLRGVVSCLKIPTRCKSSFVVSLPSEVKKSELEVNFVLEAASLCVLPSSASCLCVCEILRGLLLFLLLPAILLPLYLLPLPLLPFAWHTCCRTDAEE